jgi:hypothetical protein
MSILLVTGIEGAQNCAAVLETQLGTEIEVAAGCKAALAALRTKEYAAVVIDETLAECDPAAAERICAQAGLAIPLQINFAVSGAARLTREIRAALHRRDREQALARRAAAAAIEAELKSTVAGLLLHSQLALSGDQMPGPAVVRLRVVADLAASLRQHLTAPDETCDGARVEVRTSARVGPRTGAQPQPPASAQQKNTKSARSERVLPSRA